MSNTLLEHTRGLHEDLERLERVIVKDYKQDVKGHKDKLMQQHRVRKRLDQMQETAQKLARIYEDEDGARKEEVDALGGAASSIYSKFYDRLKEVRDYHRRFANTEVTGPEDDEPLLKEEPHVEFTGEEAMGRYLDLHEHHLRFINSKFGSRIDYLEYLRSVVQFGAIAKPQKLTKPYREYLEGLVSYLRGFYERTQPLTQLGKQLAKVEEDVGAKWDAGQLPGWEDRGRGRVDQEEVMRNLVDLESFESVAELQEIGADKLKEALQALGLKCGGTPQQRAERLFMCKGRALESLDPKLFAKGVVPAGALTPEQQQKMDAHAKRVAVLESQATRLSELLTNILSDTIGRTEKKQSQTYEELLAEQEEAMEEAMEEEVDEDEDEFIYNPLKLPLGWDGKPIPYWLYKLHGLNQEFKCEICGNFSYWGRRAFEKHFKEWRHQNGMRALQIPNNKNFYEVTKIEDALALHRALSEKNRGGWNPEVDEEFEDSRGNVYNKKTYEDLKRQGLLD